MKWRGDIQEYLSIGYIYLLLLGVTSDTIYYSILGINILSYSTILDVLLSPFIHLTKSIAFPAAIALIILATYLYRKRVQKIYDKREKHKLSESAEQAEISNSMLRVGRTGRVPERWQSPLSGSVRTEHHYPNGVDD